MLVAATVFPAAAPVVAAGRVFYVSPTGSDSGAGTATSPWRTINKAAATVAAGDTVNVAAGTYDERAYLRTPGTSTARVNFVASGRVVVTRGVYVKADYNTVTGFEVTPGTGLGNGSKNPDNTYADGGIQLSGSNVIAKNNYVHDLTGAAPWAIMTTGANNVVEQNRIHNPWRGSFSASGTGVVIRNNRATMDVAWVNAKAANWKGIQLGINGTSGMLVEGNYLKGPGDGNQIHIPAPVSNLTFKNNTILLPGRKTSSTTHTQTFGFYKSATNVTFDGNTIGSAEPMPSGYVAGFTHFFFGTTDATGVYSNLKFTNNVFLGVLDGAYYIQFKAGDKLSGLRFDNNLVDIPSGWRLPDAYSGIVSNNNIVMRGSIGGTRDYNLYPTTKPAGEGAKTRVGNPAFVNPDKSSATAYGVNADWNLKAGSPAIDAGTSAGTPATDRLGRTRVDDANTANIGGGTPNYFDMGVLEKTSATAPAPAPAPAPTPAPEPTPTPAPTPVTGTMAIAGGASSVTTTRVDVNSSVTGATEMRVNTGTGFSAWMPYAAVSSVTLPTGNGTKTVTCEYRNASGGALTLTDTVTLNVVAVTPVTGTMVLNHGATTTTVRTIDVGSNVTGATEMRLDNGAGFGAWFPYTTLTKVTLPAGDGVKKVTAEYRNATGGFLSIWHTVTLDEPNVAPAPAPAPTPTTEPAPAPAPTGRVLYVSTTGVDTNAGTLASPFRTIAKAVSAAVAGDTIYMRGGTYNERVLFSKSGTATSPITFAAYSGEKVIISRGFKVSGNYNVIRNVTVTPGETAATADGAQMLISGSNNQLSGITHYDTAWASANINALNFTGSNNTVRDIDFHHTGAIRFIGRGAGAAAGSGENNKVIGGSVRYTRDKNVLIEADKSTVERLDLQYPGQRNGGDSADGIAINGNNVTVRGCIVRNVFQTRPIAEQHPDAIIWWNDGNDLVIEDTIIGSTNTSTYGGAKIWDQGHLMWSSKRSGKTSHRVIIRNNIFIQTEGTYAMNGSTGNIAGQMSGWKVLGNTFVTGKNPANGANGNMIRGASFAEIRSWTIADNYFGGRGFDTTSIPTGCTLRNNAHSNYAPYAGATASFRTDAPAFVAPDLTSASQYGVTADWRVKATSPLVAKGVANTALADDRSGTTRPNPPSIGAYEPGSPLVFQPDATASLSVMSKPASTLKSYWSKTSISASLESTTAMRSASVVLREYDYVQGKWRTRSAVTNENGVVTFPLAPANKTKYRIEFAGTTGTTSALTPYYTVTPRANLSAPVAPRSMSRTRYYTVTGTLKSRHSVGTKIRVYKYRYVNGKYRADGYVTARVVSGTGASWDKTSSCTYSVRVRLPYKGYWRLRAYHPADAGHPAAWSSGWDFVTVK